MLLAALRKAPRNRRGFSSRPPRRHHVPPAPPPSSPPPPPLPPGVLSGVTEAMRKFAVAGEEASAALGRAAAELWPSGVPRSLPPWVYSRLHWAPEGMEARKETVEKRV